MDERIWQLPGPRGLIRDVLRELDRGRHVAIVLPRTMAEDATVTGGLVQELVRELNRTVPAQEIPPDPEATSLLAALSRALVWENYPPATVSDLLAHSDTFGRVAVVVASDISEDQQAQLPDLLRRFETESRSTSTSDRLALVTVGHRGHLPQYPGGENSDVNLATVWWWNRIARWDVAAHISHSLPLTSESRILHDVRAETVVEIARWDLDLAELLAASWNGDPSAIPDYLSPQVPAVRDPPESLHSCGRHPGNNVVELWDAGHLDGWHDVHDPNVQILADSKMRLDRLVWAAQARILMPWIEERRAALHNRTVHALGEESFRNAVDTYSTRQYNTSGVVEIGDLKDIINARIGKTDPWLRSAAHRLHAARNALAHLEPLPFTELTELARACEGLR